MIDARKRALLLGAAAFSASAAFGATAFADTARQAVKFEVIGQTPVPQEQVVVPPLLGAEDLKKLIQIGAPQIVDIRRAKALLWNYSYAAGHIPGAVNVPFGTFRKLWADPLSVPTDAQFTELVQSMGLTKDRPVVLVHSSGAKGNFGFATFAYWTLKSAGFTNMAILNGGIKAWKASGGEMTQTPTKIVRSDEVAVANHTWLATHEDVDAVLNGTSHAQLLDARPLHQIMDDASLEGSFTLNAEDLIGGEHGQAADDLSIFLKIKQAGLDWEYDEVITYCNNGALATVDWFMANEIAGIPNVKVYGHSLKARRKAEAARAKNG